MLNACTLNPESPASVEPHVGSLSSAPRPYLAPLGGGVARSGGLPLRVALTFDDGTHGSDANAYLDVLPGFQARVTFFLVGRSRALLNIPHNRCTLYCCSWSRAGRSRIHPPGRFRGFTLPGCSRTSSVKDCSGRCQGRHRNSVPSCDHRKERSPSNSPCGVRAGRLH